MTEKTDSGCRDSHSPCAGMYMALNDETPCPEIGEEQKIPKEIRLMYKRPITDTGRKV